MDCKYSLKMSLAKLLALAGLLIFSYGSLHAQCPQVGNALDGTPLYEAGCADAMNNSPRMAPIVNYWAAFAIGKNHKLGASWGYGSASEAEQAAHDSCVQGGGTDCLILGRAFTDNTAAVAVDAADQIYFRLAEHLSRFNWSTKYDPEKTVLRACGELTKAGGCRLLSGGVYSGSNYGIPTQENQHALTMSEQELLALTKKCADKKYLDKIATETGAH